MSPVVVACIRAMAVLSALQDQKLPRGERGFQLDLSLPCNLSSSFRLYFNWGA